MTDFLAAVKVLGELVKGIRELISFIKQNKNEKWFQDTTETFQKLRAAKTSEEKMEAAKRITDIISRM